MTGVRFKWRPRWVAALLVALAPALSVGLAQNPTSHNERQVARPVGEDRSGVWVLDFRFKDPRIITVDIPGRGKRIVWYLWYQVINNSGEPRTFIPDFDLVTLDKNTAHHDQVLPKAQEAIKRLEDPTRFLDIKNSVTIGNDPIPPSKPDAVPRAVTGVATWDDVEPDTTRFSIFVSGLSNGWSVDDKQTVRRKTLQLNFRRVGDQFIRDSREIRFVPSAEWIYRATSLTLPGATPPKEGEAPKKEPPPNEKEGEEPKTDVDKPAVRISGGL